jgi:hypothetical protein
VDGIDCPAHEPGDFRRALGVLITQLDHPMSLWSQLLQTRGKQTQLLFGAPVLGGFVRAKRFHNFWRQPLNVLSGSRIQGLQRLESGDCANPRAEVRARLKG